MNNVCQGTAPPRSSVIVVSDFVDATYSVSVPLVIRRTFQTRTRRTKEVPPASISHPPHSARPFQPFTRSRQLDFGTTLDSDATEVRPRSELQRSASDRRHEVNRQTDRQLVSRQLQCQRQVEGNVLFSSCSDAADSRAVLCVLALEA